jgi:hypothetical protein
MTEQRLLELIAQVRARQLANTPVFDPHLVLARAKAACEQEAARDGNGEESEPRANERAHEKEVPARE